MQRQTVAPPRELRRPPGMADSRPRDTESRGRAAESGCPSLSFAERVVPLPDVGFGIATADPEDGPAFVRHRASLRDSLLPGLQLDQQPHQRAMASGIDHGLGALRRLGRAHPLPAIGAVGAERDRGPAPQPVSIAVDHLRQRRAAVRGMGQAGLRRGHPRRRVGHRRQPQHHREGGNRRARLGIRPAHVELLLTDGWRCDKAFCGNCGCPGLSVEEAMPRIGEPGVFRSSALGLILGLRVRIRVVLQSIQILHCKIILRAPNTSLLVITRHIYQCFSADDPIGKCFFTSNL